MGIANQKQKIDTWKKKKKATKHNINQTTRQIKRRIEERLTKMIPK